MKTPVDVLLVSPSTTPGWRRADADFAAALRSTGMSVAVATTDFRLAKHLRRTVLLTDVVEAMAMRRALTRMLRRHDPRAIVFSSPQAAMLQPRRRLSGPSAVRFDQPAALNRVGFGAGLLHFLERRALGRVRLLLPAAVDPGPAIRAHGLDTPVLPLPWPVPMAGGADIRDPVVLAYAGNPEKKGLDLLLRAWGLAAPAGWRLVVTGIAAQRARRYLKLRGEPEPPNVEWTGLIQPDRYRELLGSARVFASAARREEYGLAQLEALGAGLSLVTVPATGVYPGLELARALDPRLVAAEPTPHELGRALEAAIAMGEPERAAYAERARALLTPYSDEALRRRVSEALVPALLG